MTDLLLFNLGTYPSCYQRNAVSSSDYICYEQSRYNTSPVRSPAVPHLHADRSIGTQHRTVESKNQSGLCVWRTQ